MRKLAILCLVVAALNAVIYYEPKSKNRATNMAKQ